MIRLGTRASPLARAQAERAARRIEAATRESVRVVPLSSLGDEDTVRPLSRFLEPGAFTGRLDHALLDDEVDIAVHSLKDVPLRAHDGLSRTYAPERIDPRDLLLLRRDALDGADDDARAVDTRTPHPDRFDGLRIGTSAPRRRSQLLDHAPAAVPVDLRGSIGTRIHRLATGELDGLFLAKAADDRGGPDHPPDTIPFALPLDLFPTAPGQGALALQTRAGGPLEALLAEVEDPAAAAAVEAERGLLADMGGGCGLPLGATCVPDAPAAETADTPDAWRFHVTYVAAPHTVPGIGLRRAVFQGDDPQGLRHRAHGFLRRTQDADRASDPRREGPNPSPSPQRIILVQEPPEGPDPWRILLADAGHDVTRWWPFTTTHVDTAGDKTLLADWQVADWCLVTSARAVPTLAALEATHPDPRKRIVAVGPASARALHARALAVTLVPATAHATAAAEALLARLGDETEGTVVLWPTQPHADDAPARILQAAGVEVRRHHVYALAPDPEATPPAPDAFDTVLFTSARTARTALERFGPEGRRTLGDRRIVAIGPVTAEALRAAGLAAEALPRPTPTAFTRTLDQTTDTPHTPGA